MSIYATRRLLLPSALACCLFLILAGTLFVSAFRHPNTTSAQDDTIPLRLRAGTFDPLGGSALAAQANRRLDTSQPALRLIQFPGPIQDAWYQAMVDAGVDVVAYMPDYAYLVWASEQDVHRVQATTPARWAGTYQPIFALHPNLASADEQPQTVDVLVQVYETAGTVSTIKTIVAETVEIIRPPASLLGYTTVGIRISSDKLSWLTALPGVVSVEPAPRYELLDEVQGQIVAGNVISDGSRATGPGYLTWLTETAGVPTNPAAYPIVDVTDDGIDIGSATPQHPDFYEFGDRTNGDRLVYNYNWTSDSTADGQDGHGTLNAAIVAGYNDRAGSTYEDTDGYNYGVGINPFGRVAGSKVFRNTANGGGFDLGGATYTDLISNSYALGARISTNSWGCTTCGGSYLIDDQMYDALVRDAQPGSGANEAMHILFAAGNQGPSGNSTGSPANAKNVITVGASENYRPVDSDGCGVGPASANDSNDIAAFSSRGPTDDGRIKPDIVAPGTHVIGAASQDPEYDGSGVCGPKYYPSGQTLYTWSSGTSHSTPAAAGAASLLYRYYRDHYGAGAPPSPAMLKAYMINSSRYLDGIDSGDTLPSPTQGYGAVNLTPAFDDAARLTIDQNHVFSETGGSFTVHGRIDSSTKPFRVTLAWTDAPGSTTGAAYVNNLDLKVTVEGQTYLGNVFSGGTSIAGGTADQKNNVESVFLPAGVSGAFKIDVTAPNVAGDGVPGNGDPTDQDFALVIHNGEERTGYLRGTVSDAADGTPIESARVEAISGSVRYSTTTDASGAYRLVMVPGSYSLNASKYGYSYETVAGVMVSENLTTTQAISLSRTSFHTLTGRVTDAGTGAPLSSTVTIRDQFGAIVTTTKTPLATGRYTRTLFGGTYSVTAAARLHRPATSTVTLNNDTTLDLSLPATTTDGMLFGRVTNEATGTPLIGATLRVHPGMTETVSGSAGRYDLQLPTGSYTVTVSGPFHSTVTDTNVVIPQSNLLERNYALPAAHITLDPPAGLSTTLDHDQRLTQTLTVSNVGRGDLSFTTLELPAGAGPRGGPDAFGYTHWDNITITDGVHYNWIDTTADTALPLADDGGANLQLPFSFTLYGTTSRDIRVSNNGSILFGTTSGEVSWQNTALSNTSSTNLIAAFWDDLDATDGNVYYGTRGTVPHRRFIVTWYNRPHWSTEDDPGTVTLQAIFYETTNNIKFQYQDVEFGVPEWDNGNSATVGIKGTGDDVLQYSVNAPVLTAGMGICFDYPGTPPCDEGDIPWLSRSLIRGTVPISDAVTVSLTYDTSQVKAWETYTGTLRFYTNAPDAQPHLEYPVTLTVPPYTYYVPIIYSPTVTFEQ